MRCKVGFHIDLKNKLNKKKIIIILLLSIITLLSLTSYIIKVIDVSFEKKEFTLTNAIVKDYDFSGDQIISKTDDAQLDFVCPKLFLSSVQINFDKPLEQDTSITVYFNTGNGYSENQIVKLQMEKGEINSLPVNINSVVNSFRIDLGEKINQKFNLKNVIVNNDSNNTYNKLKYFVKSLVWALFIFALYIAGLLIIILVNFRKTLSFLTKSLLNLINFIKKKSKVLINKRIILRIIGGILVIVFGLLIEFFIDYNSINKDSYNLKIDNNQIVSNDISIINNKIITKKKNSVIEINLDGKYVKNLAIKVDNGIGAPIQVIADGKDVVTKNFVYLFIADYNKIPLVYNINNKVNNLKIMTEDSNIAISEISLLNGYTYNFPKGIFYSGIMLLAYCVFFIIKYKKTNVEVIFLTSSLIIGSIFALTLPASTLVSWDDEIHYVRSASLLSTANYLTENEFNYYTRTYPAVYSLDNQNILNQQTMENTNNSQMRLARDFNIYTQIAYIPSAIVLSVGKLLNIPYYLVYIFGRWINVLIYSFISYFAIKKLKTGKVIMAIIALFPTAVFLSANYSYDPWVTAFLMLGFAYLFNELQQPNKIFTISEWSKMFAAFLIGLAPKAIYFPILLLPLLIKKNKFLNNNDYKIYLRVLFVLFIITILSFLLPFFAAGTGGDMRGGNGVNPIEQIKFILTSPIEYAKIVFNFCKYYLSFANMENYISNIAYIGKSDFMILFTTLIIAIVTDKKDYDNNTSTKEVRISIGLVFIVTVILITTALYVSFNPVASITIAGVQGRYLLPLLFPVAIVLGSCKIKNNIRRDLYNIIMLAVPTFVLLQTIWELCIKLYY